MTTWPSTLVGGWYRIPRESRLVLLCGRCAEKRGYWPADLAIQRDEGDHRDCADCGGAVE